MKHEPIGDHAERKRILALIERCEKEQTMSRYIKLADALQTLSDTCYLDEIDKNMQELPSIDIDDAVSVVHGKWMPNPKIGWGETWVCSICGEKTTSSVMGYPRYNYCPMCGAKMDGEREGE